jgi:aminoglycoside/choline kinase family phosphotransferase
VAAGGNLKHYLGTKLKGVKGIKKIRGEASTRVFYRVFFDDYSLVAMVYPGENKEEISRIVKLTGVYKAHHIDVPGIEAVMDNRVILQEDLGDLSAQRAFSIFKKEERKKLLETAADILIRLKGIAPSHTGAVLDTARMKWEMDFFLTHFAPGYLSYGNNKNALQELRGRLYRMVEQIRPIDTFAHRDYHSRNMLIYRGGIYLVDFQDSLVASPYYDVVSFAFDSYLDLKSRRAFLLDYLRERGMVIDGDLLYITALQRNIKALGTFAYQVMVRRNLSYKRYINRTLRHIVSNPLSGRFFDLSMFSPAPSVVSRIK